MTTRIELPDASVALEPVEDDRLHVQVRMRDPAAYNACSEWITAYTPELVEAILAVKGPVWLCDELRRDEDPLYVENDFRHDVLSFIGPEGFGGKRVLDFGCGCGASTAVVTRLLPGAEITGVELDAPSLDIARRRAAFHGFDHVRLLLSPGPQELPPDLGTFDFILFSAVFEHLLPQERTTLLPRIWSLLRPGGTLFLNQTPHRWFPIEGHTTGLPLLNYLPDRLAHWTTARFCRRIPAGTSWETLLRMGIRGGTVNEILGILRSTGEMPTSRPPARNGISDHLQLWDRSSAPRHPGRGHAVKVSLIKAVRALTGVTLVPNISLAIQKSKETAAP